MFKQSFLFGLLRRFDTKELTKCPQSIAQIATASA